MAQPLRRLSVSVQAVLLVAVATRQQQHPAQPRWTVDARLPSLGPVGPLRGHHQGGTAVTVFGAGFTFNGTDPASVRCCWDHHPGYAPSQIIGSPTTFPNRSTTVVIGGDGISDFETAAEALDDFHVVCRSPEQIPGYTHTDDLLLSFGRSCNESAGALLDTLADFEYFLDLDAMGLHSVHPRGGPVDGGTAVVVRGVGYGGRALRCRFGFYTVVATYVDATTLHCVSPRVDEPRQVWLEVTPDDGVAWTLPLNFTFYDTRAPRLSAVMPLGGPSRGGGAIYLSGAGLADYGGLAVLLGNGSEAQRLPTFPLNESVLMAFVPSNASEGVHALAVTLNGDVRAPAAQTASRFGTLYELPRLSAVQSSTALRTSHVAANCIDEDMITNMCHTEPELTPWLSVQLPSDSDGAPAQVSQIVIYNRYDCCWDRLSPFQLWVGQSAGDYQSSTSTLCGRPNLSVPATRGPFEFDCVPVGGGSGPPLRGNYVTLVLTRADDGPSPPMRILNLGGIRVFSPFYSDLVVGLPTYRVYSEEQLHVSEVMPQGAVHSGGTMLTLIGHGFRDLGGPSCAFGERRSARSDLPVDPLDGDHNRPPRLHGELMEVLTPATILGPAEARCRSPTVPMHPAQPSRIEFLLNGDRATKTNDGLPFTFYGQAYAELVVSAISPLGAPVAGGTPLTLFGSGLADLGDARVRFGRYGSVQARVSSDGRNVTCVTPAVSSGGVEPLAFSADGATFVRTSLQITLFDIGAVHLSRRAPLGGPLVGGTLVRVQGVGFASLPAACLFGEVAAVASVDNSTSARCIAPAINISASVPFEISLNGERHNKRVTDSGFRFAYFNASAVSVSAAVPLGGPSAGGTAVMINGSGFADLGGVHCRFGAGAAATVPATVRSSTQLACTSPPVPASGVVQLAFTFNDDMAAFVTSSASFDYYAASVLSVSRVRPVGGPSAGGTLLNVSGTGFATLGSVFCRFGIADRISPGTVVSAQLVQCVSPRIRGPAVLGGVVPPAGQRERVEVSLNGQDYMTVGPWFMAYDHHVRG